MVKDDAIVHGGRKVLARNVGEAPLVLQLGGSVPEQLAAAARAVVERLVGAGGGGGAAATESANNGSEGTRLPATATEAADAAAAAACGASQAPFCEVNLNCGCPSERVRTHAFGAVLMRDAPLVGRCMAALREALPPHVQVSVKCRLGVDDMDSYEELLGFVDAVHAASGVSVWILHARKCWLHGLTPAQNRTVPPLRHEWVYRLAHERPALKVVLNGGVKSVAEAKAHMAAAPIVGVMLGRAAYHAPWDTLAAADWEVFGEAAPPEEERVTRRQVLERYKAYGGARMAEACAAGLSLSEQYCLAHAIVKPLKELFSGETGRRWFSLAMNDSLAAWKQASRLADKKGLAETPGFSVPAVIDGALAALQSFKWGGECLDTPAGVSREERRRRRLAAKAEGAMAEGAAAAADELNAALRLDDAAAQAAADEALAQPDTCGC